MKEIFYSIFPFKEYISSAVKRNSSFKGRFGKLHLQQCLHLYILKNFSLCLELFSYTFKTQYYILKQKTGTCDSYTATGCTAIGASDDFLQQRGSIYFTSAVPGGIHCFRTFPLSWQRLRYFQNTFGIQETINPRSLFPWQIAPFGAYPLWKDTEVNFYSSCENTLILRISFFYDWIVQ